MMRLLRGCEYSLGTYQSWCVASWQTLAENRQSSGYSVALGSLPGCPVLVPGHSHMNGILEWSLGYHIHQLEFLPYSAAIFRALHFGLFETEARVSRLLMEKVGLSLL